MVVMVVFPGFNCPRLLLNGADHARMPQRLELLKGQTCSVLQRQCQNPLVWLIIGDIEAGDYASSPEGIILIRLGSAFT